MEKSEYYVYVHKRASDGQPFYYGRGKDRRAWEPYRNPWHANIVAKHGVIVEILQTGLTRDEGSALEKQLIKAAKEAGGKLCNMTDGDDDPMYEAMCGRDRTWWRGYTYTCPHYPGGKGSADLSPVCTQCMWP